MEAPRESEIRAAVEQLRDADAGTLPRVEGLARQLPREVFARTLKRLPERLASSAARGKPIRNHAGYFIGMLREALDDQTATHAAAAAQAMAASEQPPTHIERIRRERPEEYLAQMAQVPGFDVGAYLREYVADPAERERLARLFADDERVAA